MEMTNGQMEKTTGVVAPSMTIVVEQSPGTGMGWKLATNESRIAPRNDLLEIPNGQYMSEQHNKEGIKGIIVVLG